MAACDPARRLPRRRASDRAMHRRAACRIDLANMRATVDQARQRSSSSWCGTGAPATRTLRGGVETGVPATRTLRGGAETKAIRFGKLWDGSKPISRRRRRGRRRSHHLGRDRQRRGAAWRAGDRSAQVHRHPRPDRSPHAHHLLLGSQARHAPARISACPPSRSISRRTTRDARSRPASRPCAISTPATTWISRCAS